MIDGKTPSGVASQLACAVSMLPSAAAWRDVQLAPPISHDPGIEFRLNRVSKVLLVRFRLAFSRENLQALDEALAKFVTRWGTCDTIADFSAMPNANFPASILVERGREPPLMPNCRRVFVARDAAYYGMFRLYAAYQEAGGFEPPVIVDTLDEALSLMGADRAQFLPI